VSGTDKQSEEKPPFNDILIPTDGSGAVWEEIKRIRPIGSLCRGTVHALYVQPKGSQQRDQLRSDPMEEAEETVAQFERKLTRDGLQTTTAVRSGMPAEEIVRYADNEGIDLIVMVTHSESPMGILGKSVTEKVFNRSSVPLMALTR